MKGFDDKRVALPVIEREEKLPVVLSREELKRLLKAPELLKHRILLGLLYDCGLRCLEVRMVELRHTCATHMLEDGVDIISIRKFPSQKRLPLHRIECLHIDGCGRCVLQKGIALDH